MITLLLTAVGLRQSPQVHPCSDPIGLRMTHIAIQTRTETGPHVARDKESNVHPHPFSGTRTGCPAGGVEYRGTYACMCE